MKGLPPIPPPAPRRALGSARRIWSSAWIAVVVSITISAVWAQTQERPDTTAVQGAIDRGLTFLARDALAWKAEHNCSSCHHAALVVWAMNEAKQRDHTVDKAVLDDLVGQSPLKRSAATGRGPEAAITAAQILNSVFNRARMVSSKSGGMTPRRPAMTHVLSVQSLSIRTTDEALRRVRFQAGWVDSTATPKRRNFAGDSVVMKANTKSPGDSAGARTTQGRRLTDDKSVNGNAARTMSPTCGVTAKIGVLVTRFDVSVGIEVRLRREKFERPAGLRDSRHLVASQTMVPWLRDDEHQPGKPGRTVLRRDANDAGFVHLDHQGFHAPSLPRGKTA